MNFSVINVTVATSLTGLCLKHLRCKGRSNHVVELLGLALSRPILRQEPRQSSVPLCPAVPYEGRAEQFAHAFRPARRCQFGSSIPFPRSWTSHGRGPSAPSKGQIRSEHEITLQNAHGTAYNAFFQSHFSLNQRDFVIFIEVLKSTTAWLKYRSCSVITNQFATIFFFVSGKLPSSRIHDGSQTLEVIKFISVFAYSDIHK